MAQETVNNKSYSILLKTTYKNGNSYISAELGVEGVRQDELTDEMNTMNRHIGGRIGRMILADEAETYIKLARAEMGTEATQSAHKAQENIASKPPVAMKPRPAAQADQANDTSGRQRVRVPANRDNLPTPREGA